MKNVSRFARKKAEEKAKRPLGARAARIAAANEAQARMKGQVLELASRVDAGTVAGVLVITADPNGGAAHSWVFGPSVSGVAVVGALEVVKLRLLTHRPEPQPQG